MKKKNAEVWSVTVVAAKKLQTLGGRDHIKAPAILYSLSAARVRMIVTVLHSVQVETIGDAYCVAGGLHKESETHAVQIALMALKMMELSDECMTPTEEPIQVRAKHQPLWSCWLNLITQHPGMEAFSHRFL